MARTRTLAEMATEARQRADMENSTFISNSELHRYLNLSISELYDKLLLARGDEYYLQGYEFTATAGEDLYLLPDNFYKLIAVDVIWGGVNITATPLNFQSERNRYQQITGWNQYFYPVKYMLQGNAIKFFPEPAGNYTVKMWYVPTAPTLTVSESDNVNADYEWSMTTTVNSNKAVITAYEDVVNSITFDVGEWANLLQPGNEIDGTNFAGTPNPRILQIDGLNVYLTSTGLYSTTLTGVAFYNPTSFDGINGWEDYVIVDTAIRMLNKEESDPGALMAEKAEMVQRLEEMAAQRDMGQAKTLQDVSLSYTLYDDVEWRNG